MSGAPPVIAELRRHAESLKELLNVSGLNLNEDPSAADSAEAVQITVARANGQKCERCWHWETDVGASAAHPTLCGRCVKVVERLG